MTWTELLWASAWKGTIVLAAAFAVAWTLRRRSAALRHSIWTAAFAVLLLLPVALEIAPRWKMPALPLPQVMVVTVAASTSHAPSPASLDWKLILLAAGFGLSAAWFLAGILRTAWLVGRAKPVADPCLDELRRALRIQRKVRLLESADVPAPLTWGILRPVILLPIRAAEWPAARLRSVLLHELVHIRRFDVLAQSTSRVVCCVFWFHPLAWAAARQMRRERELACDDAVLLHGVDAPEYAGHLMELVRAMASRRRAWASAPGMAESSDLESRVRALLDGRRNRLPLSRKAAALLATLALIVLVPLAGIHAQVTSGALAGIVQDPSGSRVVNCQVTAKNLDGKNQEVTKTNAAGEYVFTSIPPGHYALEFSSRGFSRTTVNAVVEAGIPSRVDANLAIGTLTEEVTITAARPGPAPVMPRAETGRIKIGGNVQAARLIHQAKPVYPDELKQLGIEGTVVIQAIISKNGDVLVPKVVNTVDQRLADAALEAVRQWQYEPTKLNGEPVEMLTTISLTFQLGQ